MSRELLLDSRSTHSITKLYTYEHGSKLLAYFDCMSGSLMAILNTQFL